jgi:hypothetical protein
MHSCIFVALAQKFWQNLYFQLGQEPALQTFVFKMAIIKAPCQKSLSKLVDSEEKGKK